MAASQMLREHSDGLSNEGSEARHGLPGGDALTEGAAEGSNCLQGVSAPTSRTGRGGRVILSIRVPQGPTPPTHTTNRNITRARDA
jgi:hypothetical protein